MFRAASAIVALLVSGCERIGFTHAEAAVHCELNDGLLANWAFDESSGIRVVDASGRDHHAELCAGPTCPAPGPSWLPSGGVTAGAVSFDGVDDCVTVPFSPDLELGPGKSVTLAGWYRALDSDFGTGDEAPAPEGRPLSLGCVSSLGVPPDWFALDLDDLRIYDRLLSPNQVAELARFHRTPDTTSGLPSRSPLGAWVRLNA